MSVKQNTLKGEFSLKGKGLHTGKEVCATFKPAAENTGYKIVRVDLDEKTEIPALAKYIELVDRASCLQKDGAKVYTLEHAMAALYGCGIDNCVIELSGEEFPDFGWECPLLCGRDSKMLGLKSNKQNAVIFQ